MTKEDIKKAATEYANEACRSLWRTGKEQVCMVDFIEGAKWRINSVWHDATEKPTKKKIIIVVTDYGYMLQISFIIGADDWDEFVNEGCIAKWCYKEDLLPNMEE